MENVDIKYVIIGQLVEQNTLLTQAVKQAQTAAQADKARIADLENKIVDMNTSPNGPWVSDAYDHFAEDCPV